MKIMDIIIWILFIISLIVVGWYLFGNSPTMEETLLAIIITFLFTISGKLIKTDMKINYINKKFDRLENSFSHLAKDFKQHLIK